MLFANWTLPAYPAFKEGICLQQLFRSVLRLSLCQIDSFCKLMKASICQGFKILKQLPLEVNCETSYWSWAQNPGLWLAGSCQKVYWPGFENNQTTPFGVTLQTSSSSISPINGWVAIQTLLFLWIKIFAARFFLNVKKLQKYKSLENCDHHHFLTHQHHHQQSTSHLLPWPAMWQWDKRERCQRPDGGKGTNTWDWRCF